MYACDNVLAPKSISRAAFVEKCFDLGLEFDHGYNTIIAAVNIGDDFCSFNRPWKICDWIETVKNEEYEIDDYILKLPVQQIYSVELAHVVTLLTAKIHEDDGYCFSNFCVQALENRYIYKLEWELCFMFNFHFPLKPNYITILYKTINSNDISPVLNKKFWYLSKEICLNKSLMQMNPFAILLGIILLHRKNKLIADIKFRAWKFVNLLSVITFYVDTDQQHIVRMILKHQKSKK